MMQSNEVSPSLLDKLDQAYEKYLLDEQERQERPALHGVMSAKNFIFGGGSNDDPNFSNRLIEV